MRTLLGILFVATFTAPVLAGEADVVDVKVSGSGGTYNFSVTVKHDDTGWGHFANRWEVVGKDGTIYGTRVLAHPHVNEQAVYAIWQHKNTCWCHYCNCASQ